MFEIIKIQNNHLNLFNNILSNKYLDLYKNSISYVFYGSIFFNKPISIVVLKLDKRNRNAEIMDLYVNDEFRHKGIATKLLSYIQDFYKEREYKNLKITYHKDMSYKGKLSIEKLLEKLGWKNPIKDSLIIKVNAQELRGDKLLENILLPEDYLVKKWQDIDETTINQIKNDAEKNYWESLDLNPFLEPERIEKLNSLYLLHKGEFAGWSITHRINVETIRYTSVFVKEKYQRTAIGMYLLMNSIKKHVWSEIPFGLACCKYSNTVQINFYKKRLFQYLVYAKDEYISYKSLI